MSALTPLAGDIHSWHRVGMTRGDWISAGGCAIWLAFMAALPAMQGAVIRIDAVTLEALVAGVAIFLSSVLAIAVPLIIRRMDAGTARQDALDAAFDMGRWTYAVVTAGQRHGIVPATLEAGLRAQVTLAEQRLSALDLIAVRSAPIARRVRQVQRLGRGLVAGLPAPGHIDPLAAQFIANTAAALADAVTDLARLVERRPSLTHAEVVARLDVA
ncbi:MAG: hypothetical protein EON91_02540 [Brevundimonas sp.]|uniref:hypothetical protein n=1 Tax=Brevundimonas sp. TaxID=1871086 RepID=UPI001208CC0A|nr:hypothetical protein [Brevundimonas sp.]RZJ19091.1 MAG: hypothetical protein EON91_02540 [Brevundimonas sp.]